MEIGINPLGARTVLQYQDVEETTTRGGILIPHTFEVGTHKADVVAIGDEVTKVEVGDLVLVSLGVGDKVEFQGEHYNIVDEISILAILDRG